MHSSAQRPFAAQAPPVGPWLREYYAGCEALPLGTVLGLNGAYQVSVLFLDQAAPLVPMTLLILDRPLVK